MTMVSDKCSCSKCIHKYKCSYYKVIVQNQKHMAMDDRFMSEANPDWCLVIEFMVRECSKRETYEDVKQICTPNTK